jgi:hypothetical protein
MVRGPGQQQIGLLRSGMEFQQLSNQGDGHRLRDFRLQSSQSWNLLANLQNTESWGLPTLEYIVHFSWETMQNSKTHRTSSKFNKTPTSVNCTGSYIICNSNLHISKIRCERVGQSGAKKETKQSGRSEEKCKTLRVKLIGLQATATAETRSDFFFAAQRRKLHLEERLAEVENAVRCWNL